MKNKLMKQILKFGVVGGIAFLIDYAVLFCCKEFIGLSVLVSAALGFTISVIFNYIASVKWVFEVNKDNDPKKDFILFIILSIIGLILTEIIMWFGTDIINLNYLFVKIIATGIVMVFNFITRKIFLENNSGKKFDIKIIKDNYKYIIFALILIIFNTLFIASINFSKYEFIPLRSFVIAFLIDTFIIILFAVIIKKYEKIKLENMFLILFIPISLSYLFAFPFNSIPDESGHLFRSYEISEGRLITGNGKNSMMLNASLKKICNCRTYRDTSRCLKIKNSNHKRKFRYYNMALYSFVCYIPQALGIFIARLIGLSPLLCVYFGRLFNLAVFIALMYFSIKIIPFKKNFIFLLAFVPIVIQEAASLSSDALTIASATLFVSSIFYFRERNKQIAKLDFVYLSILSIILSLCKIVYLPICLLLFLIPKEKFSSLKKKNILIISLAIFVVLINLGWLSIASVYLPVNLNGRNSSLQIEYIFNHLPKFIVILFQTYRGAGGEFLFQAFGNSLGTLKISLSHLYILPLIFVAICILVFDNYEKININKWEKLFVGFIIFSVVMLISLSLYLQWTPVGQDVISGIQGRYFIPIFALLTVLSTKHKIMPKIKWNNKYLYLFLLVLNCYALCSIYYNFI